MCFTGDLLLINKPPGLVVHPGAGNRSGTQVNGLLSHRAELQRLPRAGIVHRLDKDTSGIMVVAASALALRALVDGIQQRQVQRSYVAICEGVMIAGQDGDQPIGRDPKHRTRQAIRDDGKPALSHIRVRERYRAHSMVDVRLATGRTHQIRVHMQSIVFPWWAIVNTDGGGLCRPELRLKRLRRCIIPSSSAARSQAAV